MARDQLRDRVVERPVDERRPDRGREPAAQHHLEGARLADRPEHLAKRRPVGMEREPALRDLDLDARGRRVLGGRRPMVLARGGRDQGQTQAGRKTGLPEPVRVFAGRARHVPVIFRTGAPPPLPPPSRGRVRQ